MAKFPSLLIVEKELLEEVQSCAERGLVHASTWCAEQYISLTKSPHRRSEDEEQGKDTTPHHTGCFAIHQDDDEEIEAFQSDYPFYMLAKNYFDLKEFTRSENVLINCKSSKAYFLQMYSRYMAGEKKKRNEMTDTLGPLEQSQLNNDHLKRLRVDLSKKQTNLDGYSQYLYGVVLKKLDLTKDAIESFIDAVHSVPTNWAAWLELSSLIVDKSMLSTLTLPGHWMKNFFLAHIYLELQLNDDAIKQLNILSDAGFSSSSYVKAELAVAYHNIRDLDTAICLFGEVKKQDPYRLEHMDIYSNVLYVKEMRPELSHLAHQLCDIDKYSVETCCVVGNYYSLRGEHEKAVLYFQRALKLNPNYLSAWTLVGLEYVEMKKTSAAIQAYRHAIEVNRRDYRAWYGLGQTYEILKMPLYSLYYYKQAQMLRPNDSRMLVALGESYEKLNRIHSAKKCYWRAYSVGDVEGMALIKLAKFHAKLGDEMEAMTFYVKYVEQAELVGTVEVEELGNAYQFLAHWYLKTKQLDDAYNMAVKCTHFSETREEGKAILREITIMRAKCECSDSPMQQTGNEDSLLATSIEQHSRSQTPPVPSLIPMNLSFTP